MGALLGKTQAEAEASHAAVLARGYGYAHVDSNQVSTRWAAADAALVLLATAFSAALMGMDHCFVS
jgi:hypothetical protein